MCFFFYVFLVSWSLVCAKTEERYILELNIYTCFSCCFHVLEEVRVIMFHALTTLIFGVRHYFIPTSQFFLSSKRHGLIKPRCRPRCERLKSFAAFCVVVRFLFKRTWILEGSWWWVFKGRFLIASFVDKSQERIWDTKLEVKVRPNKAWLQRKLYYS